MFNTEIFDTLECAPRSRRWTTAASFTLQAFALATMLAMPLIFTETLPRIQYAESISVPAARPPQQTVELVDTRAAQRTATSELRPDGRLIEPPRIPVRTPTLVDPVGAEVGPPDPNSVPYSTGPSTRDSLVEKLIATDYAALATRVEARKEPIRVSTLDEGSIVRKVQPIYPPSAKITHVQGSVVIAALIDKQGRIESLKLVSGHPLLVNAAMDAVKQWRYRPYVLNGEPIEVETQITVVFTLH